MAAGVLETSAAANGFNALGANLNLWCVSACDLSFLTSCFGFLRDDDVFVRGLKVLCSY